MSDYKFISDVEVYNRLMFAMAKEARTEKIGRLFEKMRGNNPKPIEPNLDSYVAVLQSIGRQISLSPSAVPQRLAIERVLFDMNKSGVS